MVTEEQLDRLADQVEEEIREIGLQIEKDAYANHKKVIDQFTRSRVAEYHLKGSTGYGYNDAARDKLEELYAGVFGSESALVRGQIVSGTHAIALCFFGLLRPGDELLAVQGEPYDTLAGMIGIRGREPGSLKDLGVSYRQVDLLEDGRPDLEGIKRAIGSRTKMVYIQRSRGYSLRPSFGLKDIADLARFLRGCKEDLIIFVDNCYGEFVETREPTEAGADLVAGSLIKNPGGGLAPSGGYVAGKRDLVEMAAARWTAPGVGAEIGPSPDYIRLLYQGLYLAPRCVAEALHGAVFAARFFERLGYRTVPSYDAPRTDIIQAIVLGSAEKVIKFCRGIQSASPVDSGADPVPGDMPGYEHKVIMAAGTFVQGASLELSADAPMREPYAVYLQGGLSRHYARTAAINAALHLEGR
ncbi:MAG: methionine gamma-lyase family protein [Peptococcaceae bacterium]|nr:methionine gamma-lyase family protein [Peptococcaceae bacterium]